MQDQFGHNPALADLEVLSGEWDMELSSAAFLPGRDDTAHGHVTCEWIEVGAFLVMRQSEQSVNPPSARWAIGRHESRPDYKVLYSDQRGVSRVYGALAVVVQRPWFLAALRRPSEPGPEDDHLALGEVV